MSTMYVSADLRNAALVMEHLGWTRAYEVAPATGKVCAVGAIYLATRSRLDYDQGEGTWTYVPCTFDPEESYQRGDRAVQAESWLESWVTGISDYDDVPQWNDNDEDLTPEDVVATLREAADEWDQRHYGDPLPYPEMPARSELTLAGGPTQ